MTDPEFLEAYDGQSLDELLAMETTHRIDSLVLAMEAALDTKAQSAPLSREERIILVVEALEREINNGGFDQFFLNSSKEYAADIEAALRLIGCPQQAEIAKRAIATLNIAGAITPSSIEKAQAAGGEELAGALSEFDTEYFSCDEPIPQSQRSCRLS